MTREVLVALAKAAPEIPLTDLDAELLREAIEQDAAAEAV
jgi:hypothetical protein